MVLLQSSFVELLSRSTRVPFDVFNVNGYLSEVKRKNQYFPLNSFMYTLVMGKTLRAKSDRRVIGRIEWIYGADVNLFKMLIAPRESIRWKKKKKKMTHSRSQYLIVRLHPLKWYWCNCRLCAITNRNGPKKTIVYETLLFPSKDNLNTTLENNWIDVDVYGHV